MKIDSENNSERAKRLTAAICEETGLDPAEVVTVTLERDYQTDNWIVRADVMKTLDEEQVKRVFSKWR